MSILRCDRLGATVLHWKVGPGSSDIYSIDGSEGRSRVVTKTAGSGGLFRRLFFGASVSPTRSCRRRSFGLLVFGFGLVAAACGSGTGEVVDGTPVESASASTSTVAASSTSVETISTVTTTTPSVPITTPSVPITTTSVPVTTTTRGPVTCRNDVYGFTLFVPDPWNVSGGVTADVACRQVSKPGRSGNPIIVEAYPDRAFPHGFAFLRDSDDQRALVEYVEYATEGGIDALSVVQELIGGELAGRHDLWVVIDTDPPIALFVAIEDLVELEEIREFMTQLASAIVTD